MKVLFLFNKVREGTSEIANIKAGKGHDNHFFGMFRVRKYDIETDFIELEQYVPRSIINFLRRHVLNIFWIHLPLFPLFLRYDIVISSTAYGSLLLKAILGLKKPKWVIIDFNISGTIGEATSLRQKAFKYAVSKTDGIIAISKAEKEKLKIMFPHLSDHIRFFHEGVDTNFFKPNEATPEEDFILSVGLDPSRDFKTLVEAARGLSVPVKLATKPERVKALEPLPKNVTAQLFPHDEMLKQYAKAKVIVVGLNIKSDDSNDSMGTFAIAEAMSMGKAIVATKTRSLASYIEDGVTGRLVPPRDVEAMRVAIRELLDNDNKRHEMGHRAREFAVKNVEAEIFARNLAEYFKYLMAQ